MRLIAIKKNNCLTALIYVLNVFIIRHAEILCRIECMFLFSCLCADAVVDGGWSRWSPWSRCDKRCGGGRSIRTRSCSSPPPKNGGKKCEGEKNQVKPCNTKPCGETNSPCSLALAKFRSRIVHRVQDNCSLIQHMAVF